MHSELRVSLASAAAAPYKVFLFFLAAGPTNSHLHRQQASITFVLVDTALFITKVGVVLIAPNYYPPQLDVSEPNACITVYQTLSAG